MLRVYNYYSREPQTQICELSNNSQRMVSGISPERFYEVIVLACVCFLWVFFFLGGGGGGRGGY